MIRSSILGGALALALLARPAAGQERLFVAATDQTVFGSSEEGNGPTPSHVLYVTNRSSIPVIIFGVSLRSCENVKQWCSGRPTNIRIEPGRRQNVGRVEPKVTDNGFSYRWTFSYRPDSADARVREALRAHGLLAEEPVARVIAGPPTAADTLSPPAPQRLSVRDLIALAESSSAIPVVKEEPAPAPPPMRFKVAYGSILGSTMMADRNAPVQRTGPCIDPAATAKLERDAGIARSPWRPAVVPERFTGGPPVQPFGSAPARGEVLVRWAADTLGATIPASVQVLESPEGPASLRTCTVVIQGRVAPARDRTGRAIRSWVQTPLTIIW